MPTGKLRYEVRIGQAPRLVVEPADGTAQRGVSANRLTIDLQVQYDSDPSSIDGIEVDFEFKRGSFVDIRRSGTVMQRPAPPPAPEPIVIVPPDTDASVGQFHNPYNFIPTVIRRTAALGPDLGDGPSPPLDRFHPDAWTGRLRVRLVVTTPVIVPDAARATTDNVGHVTLPVRVDREGRPDLPPTTLKGMLRSAYEAVTNSRFGVFAGHDEILGYRGPATGGAAMVPVRVMSTASGGLAAQLLKGTSKGGQDGRPLRDEPLYAAWLPRYRNGQVSPAAVRYPDGSLPAHGDTVAAWAQLVDKGRYRCWQIVEIARARADLSARPGCQLIEDGWVAVTHASIGRKHDEKVFFDTAATRSRPVLLTDKHLREWARLIADYRELHREALAIRKDNGIAPDAYLGRDPGQTAFSPHVYEDAWQTLQDGTLCYAELDGPGSIAALYPVQISRRLNELAPSALLHASLRPATTPAELSPAERLFGWASQDGPGSVRGRVRIGPVHCLTAAADAIESFGPQPDGRSGLPLAILSSPKPHQSRFYVGDVGSDGAVRAQPKGRSRAQAGYSQGRALRGRKVFPHHTQAPQTYWRPSADGIADDRYQEYWRRPGGGGPTRDNQNRSILGWVRPGTVFEFDVHVQDVSTFELGALAWLLDLNGANAAARLHYRLGGGKPLGFGSVEIAIVQDRSMLIDGAELAQRIRELRADRSHGVRPVPDVLSAAREEFKAQVAAAYGATGFETVPFIAAFLAAAAGPADGAPTHYPRKSPVPDPEGKNYEWFTGNERVRGGRAPWLPLPDLVSDRGLSFPEES